MSLFPNKGTTGGGGGSLFANAGTGGGTGSLFSGGTGATGATGGTGSLFGGNTGAGAGIGTGATGSLFGGGTGTGLTGMGTGTGTGTMGTMGAGTGGNFSLAQPSHNTYHEAELNSTLERFGEALNVQNPLTCQLKHPVYQVAQIHGQPPADVTQYRFLFDQNLWEEYQKNLPTKPMQYQFYVSFVCGVEALEKRFKTMTQLFETLNKTESDLRTKQDGLLKEYDAKLRENINRIKRKNFILLEKLLTVHAILEKVALQYNECNRKPNEEMRVYNKYVTMEALPNEIQTRLLDIRLNRENANITKSKNPLTNTTDSESKKNVLDLLSKMKKGCEILNKIYQEDANDVDQMLKYAESKGRLY